MKQMKEAIKKKMHKDTMIGRWTGNEYTKAERTECTDDTLFCV